MRCWIGVVATLSLVGVGVGVGGGAWAQTVAPDPAAGPAPQGATLDLSQPFHTVSPWRLVVTEGPPVKDAGDNDAPGALTLCLRKGPAGPCVSAPVTPPTPGSAPDAPDGWGPHYLLAAKVVYPRGSTAPPLLLITTGSIHAGNGDQVIATQLVAYDARRDVFRRVYANRTGHNNNQETRFVTEGPLRGSVITASPQDRRPYGYWIAVNQPTPEGSYREVLRFGGATRYNDGNPLPVIDSEMPNIERRLGRWRPGQPLPIPLGRDGAACSKPELRHGELWCE